MARLALDVERLAERHSRGEPLWRIARDVSCTDATVRAHLLRAGLYDSARAAYRRARAPVPVDWLQARLDEGLDFRTIAELAECPLATVIGVSTRFGLRKPRTPTELRDARWLSARVEAGYSDGEIADQLDVSVSTVSQWRHRHHIEQITRSQRRAARASKTSQHNTAPAGRPAFPKLTDRNWLLTNQHRPTTELAVELGCHRSTVTAAFQRAGIKRDTRPHRQLRNWNWLHRHATDSVASIAEQLECSKAAVYNAYQRAGIKRPDGRGRKPTRPHGTIAAYQRHLRHGESPCDACREAHNAYKRRRYGGTTRTVSQKRAPPVAAEQDTGTPHPIGAEYAAVSGRRPRTRG